MQLRQFLWIFLRCAHVTVNGMNRNVRTVCSILWNCYNLRKNTKNSIANLMICDAAPFLYSSFPIHFSYAPADSLFLHIYNHHCVTLPYELIGIFYCILTLS